MDQKFTYYDLVAHLVPGTIILSLIALSAKLLGFSFAASFSNTAKFGAAIALAYIIGHALQGISSQFESFYEKMWGGKPSVQLLSSETKYFIEKHRLKLLEKLQAYFESGSASSDEDYQQLFSHAAALVNKEGIGRVNLFNASYALHRVMLTTGVIAMFAVALLLLLSINAWAILLSKPTINMLLYTLVFTVAGVVVEFFRTKQRGYYFAKEVLDMAFLHISEVDLKKERVMDLSDNANN